MLVGRESELAILDTHFGRMLEGHGSVLFVTGEAGLGKTALVREWWAGRMRNAEGGMRNGDSPKNSPASPEAAFRISHSVLFSESACSVPVGNVEVGELEALQPWIDVSNALLVEYPEYVAAHAKDTKKHKKFDISKFMIDTAPSWVTMIPVLGPSVGAALEILGAGYDQVYMHNKYHGGGAAQGAQNQQQVFQQYVNMLSKIADDAPLVVFIDDMHWADASSTNLLFYLSRQITDKRVLVIATYRQEDALAQDNGNGHPIVKVKNEILRYESGDELVLGYLNASAIRQLLRATFTAYQVDDRLEVWLRRISDGNALFLTQYVRTLREDGHLDEHGRFTGNYHDASVPKTVLAVIEERTRRMSDATRELLRYAAVEGEEFTVAMLERMTKRDAMALLEELQRAIDQGFVVERGETHVYGNTPTEVYGFSHALFHQVLYRSLIAGQRKRLHKTCLDVLLMEWERRAATGLTGVLAPKILLHAEKCGAWEIVATVAFGAAQQLWSAFSEVEALEMIAIALNAIAELGTPAGDLTALRAEALLLRGQIDKLRGRYEFALGALGDARDLFTREQRHERAIDAATAIASIHFIRGALADAATGAHAALAAAESHQYLSGCAAAENLLGSIHMSREEYDGAMTRFTRALELRRETRDRIGEAALLNNIGSLEYRRGSFEDSLAHYAASLAISEAAGDRAGEAVALQNVGNVQWSRGAVDMAVSHYQRSLAIREKIGDRAGEASSLNNLGAAHYFRGMYTEALECFRRSQAINASIGARTEEALALNNMGVVHRLRGEFAESRSALERAQTLCEETQSRELSGEVLCELGLLERQEAAAAPASSAALLARAVAHLTDGLRILEESHSPEVARYATELEQLLAAKTNA